MSIKIPHFISTSSVCQIPLQCPFHSIPISSGVFPIQTETAFAGQNFPPKLSFLLAHTQKSKSRHFQMCNKKRGLRADHVIFRLSEVEDGMRWRLELGEGSLNGSEDGSWVRRVWMGAGMLLGIRD